MNSVVRKSTGEKVFWIRDITAVGESCPKCAAMDSRGAATECSPGRKPGVFFRDDLSPVGAKDSFAPTGLVCQNDTYPGLAPGATLCRRSAAEYRRGFQRKLTRKGLVVGLPRHPTLDLRSDKVRPGASAVCTTAAMEDNTVAGIATTKAMSLNMRQSRYTKTKSLESGSGRGFQPIRVCDRTVAWHAACTLICERGRRAIGESENAEPFRAS